MGNWEIEVLGVVLWKTSGGVIVEGWELDALGRILEVAKSETVYT